MHALAGRSWHAAPRAWSALIVRQCAVLTRSQLRQLHVGRDEIRAEVAARRWQVFGEHVVVLHNSTLTEQQRRWVAVLLPGQPAALAGLTAAAEAGLRGFDDPLVHVVVRRSCGVDQPSWVRLHNSRRFSASDIRAVGIPRTDPARSLVDAAAWSRAPRRACALLCAGVQQRLSTSGELERALAQAGHLRHAAIMRAVLGDIGGGGHTLAEIDLGPIARRAGLPPPRRQALRREPSGRRRYVDAEFDLPDGTVLVVEIDGAVHLRPAELLGRHGPPERDRDRRQPGPALRLGRGAPRPGPGGRSAGAHGPPTRRLTPCRPPRVVPPRRRPRAAHP